MQDLKPETRRILDLARHEDDPTPEFQTRIEKSLTRRIALSLVAMGSGAAISKPAVGAGLLVTALKSATVAGVTCGAILIGYEALEPTNEVSSSSLASVQQRRNAPRAAPRVVSSSAPAPVEAKAFDAAPAGAPVTKPPVEPTPTSQQRGLPGEQLRRDVDAAVKPPIEGAAPALASARAPTVSEPAADQPDRLAEEVRALREAQRALRSGDSQRALALLEQQRARYGSGALGQERSAARVLALCQAGQRAEARRAAAQFEAAFPGSPLLGRVRGACRD